MGTFRNFFGKLGRVVDLAITKYDNVVISRDINVDTQDSNSPGLNKIQDLCDVFLVGALKRMFVFMLSPKNESNTLISDFSSKNNPFSQSFS